jgi:hypothetical protein
MTTGSLHLPDGTSQEQCEAVLRQLDAFIRARIELDLHGARLFNAVARLRIPERQGAASVAERRGLSLASAQELQNLGFARFFDPDVEDEVRSRSMHVANAAVLGRTDMEDDLRYPGDQWIAWAKAMTPRDFLRKFRQRREEVRQGRPVDRLAFDVAPEVGADFRRARCLASRSARKVLTEGQAFGVVVEEYLDAHDPLRQEGGTRRVPDTATRPDSRYVPAEVRRRIRLRHWDRCAVPWCRNEMFLEFSHRRSKCMTGDQEVENLDLLCSKHHFLYDFGTLRIEGPTDDPIFKTVEGRVLGEDACDTDLYEATMRVQDAQEQERRRRRGADRAAARAKETSDAADLPRREAERSVQPPPPEAPPTECGPPGPAPG